MLRAADHQEDVTVTTRIVSRWTTAALAALLLLAACVDDGDSTADEENENIDQQSELPVEGDTEGTNENAVEG